MQREWGERLVHLVHPLILYFTKSVANLHGEIHLGSEQTDNMWPFTECLFFVPEWGN